MNQTFSCYKPWGCTIVENSENLKFSTAIFPGAIEAFESVAHEYSNPENLWILCPQYSKSHKLEDFQVFVTGTPDATTEDARTVTQRELSEELGVFVPDLQDLNFIGSRDVVNLRSRSIQQVSTFVVHARNLTNYNRESQSNIVPFKRPRPDKSRKIQCLVVGTRCEIFSLLDKIGDKLDSTDTRPTLRGSWISGVRVIPFHFAVSKSISQIKSILEAEERASGKSSEKSSENPSEKSSEKSSDE